MATNRTKRSRGRRKTNVSETAWALLNDLPMPANGNKFERLILESPAAKTKGQGLENHWDRHRDEILADWTKKNPCTRPSCWWRFDAPPWNNPEYDDWIIGKTFREPRKRLGGTGTPDYELMCYVPSFCFGIPDGWVDDEHFKGKGIDWSDPPVFESQAAYLKRHDLLTPAEVRWLEKHPEALEPETLTQDS